VTTYSCQAGRVALVCLSSAHWRRAPTLRGEER
jgi:hypothetical protein